MTEETTPNLPAEMTYKKRKPSLFANTALILVILALFTLAWQWLNTRQRFNEIEKSLSQKLETYQALNQQSLALAKQAEERSTQANARTVILEQKLAESRDQQEVLQTLYDQLAENRESSAIAEVEQFINIANQQLQLNSNIQSALLALLAADKRLEPLDLPRVTQLREALSLDIESLRQHPQIDVVRMSLQLEKIATLCSHIPLISERQPTLNNIAAEQKVLKATPLNHWQKIIFPIWNDIKNLVTIEHIDKPEPPLLAAEQMFYLRENIKLRLLTARIALLQRDEASYKADLSTIKIWLKQYFDAKHPDAIQAFALLKMLSDNNISIELPQLTESIAAISRYKQSIEGNH